MGRDLKMTGKEKFDTCISRSKNEEIKKIKHCCKGTIKTQGYFCFKHNVFKLVPSRCEKCNDYKRKS